MDGEGGMADEGHNFVADIITTFSQLSLVSKHFVMRCFP